MKNLILGMSLFFASSTVFASSTQDREGAKVVFETFSELVNENWGSVCGWEVYETYTRRFVSVIKTESGKAWIAREVRDKSTIYDHYSNKKCVFSVAETLNW